MYWQACMILKIYFKGLVNPKMKIKSLITHPHAVPRPSFIFGAQMKIFFIKFESWITPK